MFETEGFLFFPHSPLFHFKDGETRQRLLLLWEVRSGFLCVPQTGASVPMLLLYSALAAGMKYGLAFIRMSAKNQGAHNSIK